MSVQNQRNYSGINLSRYLQVLGETRRAQLIRFYLHDPLEDEVEASSVVICALIPLISTDYDER